MCNHVFFCRRGASRHGPGPPAPGFIHARPVGGGSGACRQANFPFHHIRAGARTSAIRTTLDTSADAAVPWCAVTERV